MNAAQVHLKRQYAAVLDRLPSPLQSEVWMISRRRFSAWQKLVAVAPLLLLAVSSPSEALLRCQMDGLLRFSCCCPARSDAPSSIPALKARGCCDREVTVHEPTAAEAVRYSAATIFVDDVVALAAPLALAANGAGRIIPAAWSHGPRGAGPPIVLLKRAFLI